MVVVRLAVKPPGRGLFEPAGASHLYRKLGLIGYDDTGVFRWRSGKVPPVEFGMWLRKDQEVNVLRIIIPLLVAWQGVMTESGNRQPTDKQNAAPSLIPQPVEMKAAAGFFVIKPGTPLVAHGPAAVEARKLQDILAPAMGFRLPLVEQGVDDGAITLQIEEALPWLGDEGYQLSVTTAGISIRAPRAAGLFYGIQTLRQLLPSAIFRRAKVDGIQWSVPCVEITDYPRFKWRGLVVDTVRHFMPKSALLKFIDTMAVHKFNSLQLLLSDDQGWRIEIRKYPKLTEIGAWRDETLIGHVRNKPWKFDGRPHGGFYTQDDIREIVRYAAERHVNVVPEIEMPGHARAAISAYPWLGCNPDMQLKPWTRWGRCSDIFNPSDETIAFLQDVLTEVMELFPSRYIHIGGDEVIKDQWQTSAEVQARIKELGLKDESELQSWFIKQMDTFLAQHGRRLIGWDDIIEGGLAPGATVMSWRGEKGGIIAARAGHDVIMTPMSNTYFDYCQGPPEKEPLAIGGNIPLRLVYEYEPVPQELNNDEARRVLGAQGQLWTEYIPTPRHLEYMAFPRAVALAEVVWSPQKHRDYKSFLPRLRHHLERLDVMDVHYRPLDKHQ